MASLSVPESRLITIQPWDVSAIKEIEKAILKSDLGLTPSSDGKLIRISIPATDRGAPQGAGQGGRQDV
jgi:ribosome recycling factor